MIINQEMTVNETKENDDFVVMTNSIDRVFALLYFILGYLVTYVFEIFGAYAVFNRFPLPLITQIQAKEIAVFAVAYAVMVLFYLHLKERKPSKGSYYWLFIMLACGLPLAGWSAMYAVQVFVFVVAASYWTLAATGRLMEGRSSHWIFFDVCNAMFIVPLYNFTCQIRILSRQWKNERKTLFAVLLGVVIAIPLLGIVLPLLTSADTGFGELVGQILKTLQEIDVDRAVAKGVRFVMAVPWAALLFGLSFGGIHGRNTDLIDRKVVEEKKRKLRCIPVEAICTALLIVCLIYALFIGFQGKYLFSAFAGKLPREYTYAQYARQGFFELCYIAAWNLIFFGGARFFTKSDLKKNKFVSWLTVLLSVLTLCLIATAMSKMGMYISIYGFTVKRIVAQVFLIWMAVVFCSIILRQKKNFEAVRFCIASGALMFSLLCVFPVESWAMRYNENAGYASHAECFVSRREIHII